MMKKQSFLTLLTFIVLLSSCNQVKETVPTKKEAMAKRIVIIALDGISVEGYQTAKHPNLDQLMADGTLSLTTRNVMPSVTLPNWTTHLTGSGPEQHGVLSNGWKKDKFILPAIDSDSDGYYPSIFKILKEGIPNIKTAFYYNWGNLINPINQHYLDEVSFEENDEYVQNYDKAFNFIVKNQENPMLVFLYSVHVDHAGHDHDWMSPQYITAIEEVDVQIGKFIEKIKKEGLYEDTHFMFFTDHGGIPESGHGGLTQRELEVPWVITGPGIKKGQIMKEPNNSVNTSTTIAYLFGCENIPLSWTGEIPMSVFESGK